MKKVNLSILVLFLVFLVGCVGSSQMSNVTPIDRSLTFLDQYQALEMTYKNQYTLAYEDEREWLSENVAPVLDKMRVAVVAYSRFALNGSDDVETRLKIIRLAREAAMKLVEEFAEEGGE